MDYKLLREQALAYRSGRGGLGSWLMVRVWRGIIVWVWDIEIVVFLIEQVFKVFNSLDVIILLKVKFCFMSSRKGAPCTTEVCAVIFY